MKSWLIIAVIHNLSSCEIKAWKKIRLERGSNFWPLRYPYSTSAVRISQISDIGYPLIGPFKIWALAQIQRPLAFALKFKRANQSWGWNHLANGRCRGPLHKNFRKAEEANFRANFSFFTSLSTAKAHGFGVKFIELYGAVDFIAIRDFSLWGESDLWRDFWPAMEGMVCLSILLEGGVTVSNNSSKRRQNGFKIGTRDKFETHLR